MEWLNWIYEPQAWLALLTLTLLEIVLGVDNIIFLTIVVGRLPKEQRARARRLGLGAAMGMRIALLFSLFWLARLTKDLFTVPFVDMGISGRDLVLILGGLFLIAKATSEINVTMNTEGGHGDAGMSARALTFGSAIFQIMLLDLVFSLDSVISAVGLADHLPVMVIAIVIAVAVMMFLARPLGDFVDKHMSVKILALAFLLLVGVALVADGTDFHIPRGYLYFAMGFSIGVEMINLRARARAAAKRDTESGSGGV
jgi:predicted tellurium resistance membrane protein TerC